MKLTNLSLSRNIISRIEKKTFCSLTQLEELDLSQNLLKSIEPEAYENLPNLEFFYVTSPNNNQIEFLKHKEKTIGNISNSETINNNVVGLKKRSTCCILI